MSAVFVDPHPGDRLQPQYFARNSSLVHAGFQGRLANAANQIVRFRSKELFRSPGQLMSFVTPTWRFAGHVSPMAYSVVMRAILSRYSPDGANFNPGATLTLQDGSGNTLASDTAYYGYSNFQTPVNVPDEWSVVTVALDASTFRNTSIRGTITGANNGRVISATVYETALPADTVNGYCDQQFSAGRGIYDADRSAPATLLNNAWLRGAGPLILYTSHTDANASRTAQTVFRNVIDNTSSTAALFTNPASYMVDLRNCNRQGRAGVPCRFEVYAAVAGAANGDVRLVDEDGTQLVSINATGAAQWYQTTKDVPPTLKRYFLQHRGSSGVDNITTYAACLYQYL